MVEVYYTGDEPQAESLEGPDPPKVEGLKTSEEQPDPQKVEGNDSSVAACTEPRATTIEQGFAFNSHESIDVNDTSNALHHKGYKADLESIELRTGKGKGHPPDLVSLPPQHSLELPEVSLVELAGLVYDLFPSGVLDKWISPQCNQSACTDIYLHIKFTSKKQWLDFFQKQEIDTQRAIFHSSGMRSLLLTRAGRSEGVS